MSFFRNNVLLLVMGLVLVGLLAWGTWLLPQFSVQNNSSLAQYQISYLSAATYMWRSGYWPAYNRVKIVYTDQEQEVYRLLNQDSTVLTLGANRQGKQATAYIHYPPDHFDTIEQTEGAFEIDVYAAICLAIEGDESGEF